MGFHENFSRLRQLQDFRKDRKHVVQVVDQSNFLYVELAVIVDIELVHLQL
jgi:hypothetical protein